MPELISICVCTCRRPEALRRLMHSLRAVVRPGQTEIELVLVDNDAQASARTVFDECTLDFPWPARYVHEPRPGVSHARNRCVSEARGEWIAFVDDDEWVDANWLCELVRWARSSQADVVMAPVHPVFEADVPAWVTSSGAFHEMRLDSGAAVAWNFCATNNVLMRRELQSRLGGFDVRFGSSGGEDVEFFFRCSQAGARLVWCQDAAVFEGIPKERLTRSWVLRRCISGGRNFARIRRRHGGMLAGVDVWLRGLAGLIVFGSCSALARLVLSGAAAARCECLAAMGWGKLTPFRARVGGYYGDAGNASRN